MPDEMTEEEELRRWAEGWGVPPTRDEALRRAVRACLDELAQRRDAEKPELVWEFSVGDGRWSARCRGREYGISFEATDCYLCGLGSYRTLAEAQAACQADADAAQEEASERSRGAGFGSTNRELERIEQALAPALPELPCLPRAAQDIQTERARQDAKWGVQDHHPILWHTILSEEVGELAKAILQWDLPDERGVTSLADIRKEAVQVAAVAQALIECIDREWAPIEARKRAHVDAAPEEAKEEAERMRLKRIASLQKFLAKMRTLQIKIPKGEIPDAR